MSRLLIERKGSQLSIGFLFWLLMILILIFGFIGGRPLFAADRGWYFGGFGLLLYVLLFLLGVKTFGWPIQG